MSSCKTKPKKRIIDIMVDGGFGYGKICIPKGIVDMVLIIICPPLYVFLYQSKQPKFDITPIITNLLLSSCLYFPGFIHALNLKSKTCGSLFTPNKSENWLKTG